MESKKNDVSYDRDAPYFYWFASLHQISHAKRMRALKILGGAESIYRLSEKQLAGMHLFSEKETALIHASQKAKDPEKIWNQFLQKDIRFITCFDEIYPERLKHIYNAPCAVFVKGSLPEEAKMSVAVVGARSCSEYGRSIANKLGRLLAENGVQVISGMAAGIDSASHAGSLAAGGDTFAVLGCGCDVCYPRSSYRIYENILAGNGGVLSEFLPGTQPKPQFFPMRNRIISALADILVVVEARERSGSLITADLALEQGKDVYAVPGRCLDALSVGCNRLIEQGAGIVTDIEHFLEITGIVEKTTEKKKNAADPEPLSAEAKRVYDCLQLTPKLIDVISEECCMNFLSVLDALDELKRRNMAQETFQNYFCKKI